MEIRSMSSTISSRQRKSQHIGMLLLSSDHVLVVRQFLVSSKYAAQGKVAINGGSNGGRR